MEIFNNLCRCCNSEKQNVLNIYQSKAFNNTTSIIDMLQYCLQETITNDSKYPDLICFDCVKQLEISYRFIKRFQLAQMEFGEAYKHIQELNVEATQSDMNKVVINTTNQNEDNKNFFTESDELQNHTEIIENLEIATNVELPQKEEETNHQIQHINVSKNLPVIYAASHANTLPDISCYICHKPFFTTKALSLHLRLSHKQKHTVT